MRAERRIDVIAVTSLLSNDLLAEVTDGTWTIPDDGGYTTDAEILAEFAGRACYGTKSWKRPNPATATNKGYLANILDHEHFSVLEHASVTLYLQGVSRSYTHELIRHRHHSYSQLSQRYEDAPEMGYVVPPAMRGNRHMELRLASRWEQALDDYGITVSDLVLDGKTHKQAREAARAFLPNCTATKVVITGNLRAWREMIEKRATEHADAEMREVTVEIAVQLKELFPHAFQDMVFDTGLNDVMVVRFDGQ